MKQHKHIIICGLHRSGTSLFQKILTSNENFSGLQNTGVPRNEGQHVQDVFKPARMFGGPGKFGFQKESFMTETHHLATEENKKKINDSWIRFWDTRKKFLVEKSPPNLVRTRFLQYVYPDSLFITIIRNPIAVSLATMKWSHTSMNSLLKHWLICHNKFKEDRRHLKQSYMFRYEDLINDPKNELIKLSKFLNVEVNLDETIEINENSNAKYFEIWDNKYLGSTFKKPYCYYLKNKYESQIQNFGYSLKKPHNIF